MGCGGGGGGGIALQICIRDRASDMFATQITSEAYGRTKSERFDSLDGGIGGSLRYIGRPLRFLI